MLRGYLLDRALGSFQDPVQTLDKLILSRQSFFSKGGLAG
jgi:hypothetical protein